MKISFVIPCYRSEKTIESVVSEIRSVVSQRPNNTYEIIMVSDHSPDGVFSIIERLCAQDPLHLKGLELARNFGQQAALMAGFSYAKGDVVFSLDDDGQAPVDGIYTAIDKLTDDNQDVIFGAYDNKQHNRFRNFGTRLNHWMAVWLIGKPDKLKSSSFFVAKRFVIDEVLRYKGPFPYISGILYRTTTKIANVEVTHRARTTGHSGYTFRKLLALWLNGFTSFSVKPLRLASVAGAVFSILGFLFGLWIVIKKMWISPSVPVGYSSTMAALLVIGGIIMLQLGLIGEYIGRIYICLNQSPQYVVGRITDNLQIAKAP